VALSVLVTRPSHQNESLNRQLQLAGFNVVSFPTIAINRAAPTPFLRGLNKNIAAYDIALFVSRNAVDNACIYLNVCSLPDSLQLGVVGKGTWQALKDKDVESHIIPADSYNSEGLLASESLQQVKGKRIIIFRGQQGRNLLGDTLRERGASVKYCEVYQRELPQHPPDHFEAICKQGFPDVAIFTSTEGLNNCFKLLNKKQSEAMRYVPWLLISERMRETARNLRHNGAIIIADSASDDGILSALLTWHSSKV
jgi:uroporphyrinogen-III synthase